VRGVVDPGVCGLVRSWGLQKYYQQYIPEDGFQIPRSEPLCISSRPAGQTRSTHIVEPAPCLKTSSTIVQPVQHILKGQRGWPRSKQSFSFQDEPHTINHRKRLNLLGRFLGRSRGQIRRYKNHQLPLGLGLPPIANRFCSYRPAMAKVCPLPTSTVVSARLTEIDGALNPAISTP